MLLILGPRSGFIVVRPSPKPKKPKLVLLMKAARDCRHDMGGLVCPSLPYTGSSPKGWGGGGGSVLYLRPADKWGGGLPIFAKNFCF